MADSSHTYPQPDWEVADPSSLGLSRESLASAAEIMARPGSNTSAFLVVRYGKIAWEQYYQGSSRAERHQLFSITKSVLSSLVGMALHEGALKTIDQPVLDFFPEFTPPPSSSIGLITLRHLLTMTTGLLWPSGGWGREPMVERMTHSPDWAHFVLGMPVRRQEIGRFHYNSGASHLLSAVLARASGTNTCEFAGPRLFTPLDIPDVQPGTDWDADPKGNTIGGWGLHLTARELARFGWLYVCGGEWQGRSIVPPDWVQESTRRSANDGRRYGYQWWLRQIAGNPVFAGLGVGGQFLFCIPGKQMVIVILSRFVRHFPDRWSVLNQLLSDIPDDA